MKLSLDDLKDRAEVITSDETLRQISGGTANRCHTLEITVTIMN
ncbi:hypothetical protein [Flavobacterium sp. ov086]|nr:hypothetical protein [Flavobacterium sp. ov086]SNR86844.1 hypothetical protein SAMN04487979_12660 [Flavobacterium sp. ov086]